MVNYKIDPATREFVMKLMEEKDRIEHLIRGHYAVLASNNVGLKGSLVDELGYPRDDIDVYEVRHARHKIICLQNDHKKVMQLIERGIAKVYEDLIDSPGIDSEEINSCLNGYPVFKKDETVNDPTFATISFVDKGSPAEEAGLRAHDELVQFGSVNYKNFKDVSQIMRIVSHSINYGITVIVRRENADLTFELVPKPWAKPGLLGCQIQTKNTS
ncbi:26S proteasome non-ATPase regulatory subunit 9 [Bombyx mori]|uniref:26S proteasome non-ATPase regulatory subunit 9 n=1 Tax=Bombyx mori TaxID=7091 RepID=Q2F5N2_BOMMO|nr:proteasome 26S non-ATPase subunit 9 [Bombyx mori]XP_004922528.1 26S proteasome non-ATPase regulatory subunit 9 [Bombyx mori]ABD36335.1 proteasome 26S non-ATPase subunit 9 [Bombyx mori]